MTASPSAVWKAVYELPKFSLTSATGSGTATRSVVAEWPRRESNLRIRHPSIQRVGRGPRAIGPEPNTVRAQLSQDTEWQLSEEFRKSPPPARALAVGRRLILPDLIILIVNILF